jgi:hypothetical protein
LIYCVTQYTSVGDSSHIAASRGIPSPSVRGNLRHFRHRLVQLLDELHHE